MKFANWFAAFDTHIAEMLDGPGPNASKAAKPVRTLIYVGEMDFICNLEGNKQWTLEMDWSQKAQYNAAPEVNYTLKNAVKPIRPIWPRPCTPTSATVRSTCPIFAGHWPR